MTVTPYDSAAFGTLFTDAEVSAQFSDVATVQAMLTVEAALARVQAGLNIIPARAARRIDQAIAGLEPDLGGLGAGSENAGIPVIALVEQIRTAVGSDNAAYVHWGATSQDIIDSGLILRLRAVIDSLAARLATLSELLAALADTHRRTIMAARTRSQQAVPTTFGLKVAGWLAPLLRHRARLLELRPRVLVVQFGGAAGTLAALGERGLEVAHALAAELGLATPVGPWHTQRDGLAELAGWLSLVTGSLGKMGQDIVLLAQSEIGELRESDDGTRGGSSAMPQKSNPVASDVLITAARMNAGLLANMHQALIQEHERGAAAWQLEWLTLPQMAVCTGVAITHALSLVKHLEVRVERMRANVDAAKGLLLAEAATVALSAHMPRTEAQALVKEACAAVSETGEHMLDLLQNKTDAPIDWPALKDPTRYLGSADTLVEQVLAMCTASSHSR